MERGIVAERERRRELRDRLDSEVRRSAEALASCDKTIFYCSMNETGAIHIAGMGNWPAEMRKVHEVVGEREAARRKLIQEVKLQSHVVDAAGAYGALVVTFNSARGIPAAFRGSSVERGDRGTCRETEGPALALVGVDMNPARRSNGVPATTTLIHELHHYAKSMIDLTDLLEKRYATGFKEQHLALAATRTGVSFPSIWDRLDADRVKYEALLERPLPPASKTRELLNEAQNVHRQWSYLDELHSSFLQKKPSWFVSSSPVYSLHGTGKHHELVGRHPSDIASAKNLFCYVQGMYLADNMHARLRNASPEVQRKVTAEEGAKEFLRDFSDEYIRFGATLGAARTVQQAERLAAEQWCRLMVHDFVSTNLERWVQHFVTLAGAAGDPANGQTLREFLLAR